MGGAWVQGWASRIVVADGKSWICMRVWVVLVGRGDGSRCGHAPKGLSVLLQKELSVTIYVLPLQCAQYPPFTHASIFHP
eukprot:scaffold18790_cov19-Tisochrysis_lutea.AAC.3